MPIEIQAVLVTMFEPGGSHQGEFSRFLETGELAPVDPADCGLDNVWLSHDGGLLAVVAGVGAANTAVSLTALGMCSCFDLSRAYWLISGIAGGDPAVTSLGSPVWTDWVIDGDLAFDIDIREAPAGWPTGIFPLGAREPYGSIHDDSGVFGHTYQTFQLNPELVAAARRATADIELLDTPVVEAARADYSEEPVALEAPRLRVGSNLSGARFWHGHHHNDWARRWVDYWSRGCAKFTTSAMEDSGSLLAIRHLERCGRADFSRVAVLRTISNFTTPPDSISAHHNLVGHPSEDAHFPAYEVALENGFRTARRFLAACHGF